MPSLDKQMDRVVVPGLAAGRFVYVLKRCGEREFVRDATAIGQVEITRDLCEARQFTSRIAARGFTMTHDKGRAFCAAEWEYVKIELVPPVEEMIGLPRDLLVDDPLDAIERIHKLHHMYSERIADWVHRATNLIADFSPPRIMVTVRAQKWAGLFEPGSRTVHYCLPYAMMHLGDRPSTIRDYEHCVAHECVHAYQKLFTGHFVGGGHGGDFYAMMRHAAMYPVSRHTHDYSVKKCVEVARALQKPFEQMAERGLLSSLPCQVVTESIKRKGIH
jgi:hypothetical protein